jgi:Tfp pilus assembly protein PilN
MVKTKFVIQITDDALKAGRCIFSAGRWQLAASETNYADFSQEENAATALAAMLQKLNHRREPLVIVLPRRLAVLRLLKVPSHETAEIEKMAAFWAPRYLPYSAEELITGYSIVSQDAAGYSSVNLNVIHQDEIERILRVLKQHKPLVESALVSSYGLSLWYAGFKNDKETLTLVICLDKTMGDGTIVRGPALLFSRAFALPGEAKARQDVLREEIAKTLDAYQREHIDSRPKAVLICGDDQQDADKLLNDLGFDRREKSNEPLPGFAALAGAVGESLNLLPLPMKARLDRRRTGRRLLSLGILAAGIALCLLVCAAASYQRNKLYLKALKNEIEHLSSRAQSLSQMRQRIDAWQRSRGGVKAADILLELHRLIPPDISLSAIEFEQGKTLVIRGRAGQLSGVFAAAGALEKSKLFSRVKVNYATKRKVESGEAADFELTATLTNSK